MKFIQLPDDLLVFINDLILDEDPLSLYNLFNINIYYRDLNKENLKLLPVKYFLKLETQKEKKEYLENTLWTLFYRNKIDKIKDLMSNLVNHFKNNSLNKIDFQTTFVWDDRVNANYNYNYLQTCVKLKLNKQFLTFYFVGNTDLNKQPKLAHIASEYNNYDILDILYKLNYDIDSLNDYNRSPVNIAASKNSKECLEKLCYYKCNFKNRDNDGHTPVFESCLHGNLECLNILYNNQCNMLEKDNYNNSPIDVAVMNNKLDIVKFYHNLNYDVSKQLGNKSPINWAIYSIGYLKKNECIEFLNKLTNI